MPFINASNMSFPASRICEPFLVIKSHILLIAPDIASVNVPESYDFLIPSHIPVITLVPISSIDWKDPSLINILSPSNNPATASLIVFFSPNILDDRLCNAFSKPWNVNSFLSPLCQVLKNSVRVSDAFWIAGLRLLNALIAAFCIAYARLNNDPLVISSIAFATCSDIDCIVSRFLVYALNSLSDISHISFTSSKALLNPRLSKAALLSSSLKPFKLSLK